MMVEMLTLITRRLPVRMLVRLFIIFSTVYGFYQFYEMHGYQPWLARTLKALGMTLEVHAGLWLATLEVQSRWRFLVAAALIPSMVGAYLLFWHMSFSTVAAAIAGMIWLFLKVVRGRRFDYQSV